MSSDCRQICEWITSYVEGGLAAPVRSDVERHVAACSPCRGRLVKEQGARSALRQCAEGLTNPALPPGLESRCRALAREQAARAGVSGWRRMVPLAVAAVLLLALGVGVLPSLTGRSTSLLAAQLTADHVKCFAVFTPRETTGADAQAAEQQLASYGWRMHVPPSSPRDGLKLLGVRRCLYAQGQIPHVMYEAQGKPISLFKLAGNTRPASVVSSFGHECRIWQRDGETFVLVGPKDTGEEMERIHEYVEREAR